MQEKITAQQDGERNAFQDMPSIYAGRRNRLRKLIQAANLDALLVSSPANRFYLSGFELHDCQPNETSGYLLILASGKDWLATDGRYKDAAEKLWPADAVFIYTGANMAAELALLMRQCGALVGYESQSLSWQFGEQLIQKCKRQPALIAQDGLVEKLRIIKEPCEIKALRQSFKLNHQMLSWLETELKAGALTGIAEKELAWEIEKFFRQNGAQELAFSTIAAAGKNAALPHAIPGLDRVLSPGLLLADVGCRVQDYCSDQTRTFWLGDKPAKEFAETMRLVRKAQEAALAIMRPGLPCAEAYNAALAVFEDAGVAQYFTHGLGHGVGLETHEAPSLSPRSSQILQKDMVVTVEPGLYYPQWGGIRWEYTVIIEENGAAIL